MSGIKRDDHTYTGNYHFQYANWEEMAKVKVNKMLKSHWQFTGILIIYNGRHAKSKYLNIAT